MKSDHRRFLRRMAASTSLEIDGAGNSGKSAFRLGRVLHRRGRLTATVAVFASVVLLTACGTKSAENGPTGTYGTDVHGTSGPFNGHWAITFTDGGSETVDFNGAEFVQEKASFTKDYVTFHGGTGSHACPAPGRYRWKLDGQELRFTLVSDTCPGRVTTLTRPLKKQG